MNSSSKSSTKSRTSSSYIDSVTVIPSSTKSRTSSSYIDSVTVIPSSTKVKSKPKSTKSKSNSKSTKSKSNSKSTKSKSNSKPKSTKSKSNSKPKSTKVKSKPKSTKVKSNSKPKSTLANDIFLRDSHPRKEYVQREDEEKKVVYSGQTKLLYSELFFLLFAHKRLNILNGPLLIVYVGSAPGTHISKLFMFFDLIFEFYNPVPVTFELFDPRPHDKVLRDYITRMKNDPLPVSIYIHEKFFTNEDAIKIKTESENFTNTLFISDIRFQPPKGQKPGDDIIKRDMELQAEWISIVQPTLSYLKFRLPWTKGKSVYFDGDLCLQIFSPPSSTELRLIVADVKKPKKYYHEQIEEQLFYYNEIVRPSLYKTNKGEITHDQFIAMRIIYDILTNFFPNLNEFERIRVEDRLNQLFIVEVEEYDQAINTNVSFIPRDWKPDYSRSTLFTLKDRCNEECVVSFIERQRGERKTVEYALCNKECKYDCRALLFAYNTQKDNDKYYKKAKEVGCAWVKKKRHQF
jgi:hypothetical protein